MRHELVIGVDSGGTTTRAVVVDARGCVLGAGRGGAGNLRDVGAAGLADAVSAAVDGAFGAAGIRRGPAEAAFLGIAGCATEVERCAAMDALAGQALAPPEAIVIDHDLRTGHAGAFLDGPGVVLIVGTGACCYGRSADGCEHRAGGWGGRLDDGGGAAWIGQQALAAVCRAQDGRGPGTVLTPRVLEGLGVGEAREGVALLERADYRRRFGAIAPLVTRAAEEGDGVALAVLERGAVELAGMVEAVAAELWGRSREAPCDLAPVGGVFESGRVLRDAIARAVAARVPACRLVEPELRPEVGAAFLALRLLGPVEAWQRDELRRSCRV